MAAGGAFGAPQAGGGRIIQALKPRTSTRAAGGRAVSRAGTAAAARPTDGGAVKLGTAL